jgi:hypothetical protein
MGHAQRSRSTLNYRRSGVSDSTNDSRVFCVQSNFARSLCHEIAHVVDFARKANRRQRLIDISRQEDCKAKDTKTETERCAELRE